MVFGDGKEVKKLGKPVTVDNDEIANKVLKQKEGAFSEGEIKPFTEEELKTWRWPIRIGLAIAVILIAAWFIYTWPISVKTATDPPEVKTQEVQTGENAVNTIGAGTVIQTSELLSRWGPLMSVDNIPAEIKLPSSENLYVTNLKFSDKKISGYVKNKGTNRDWPKDKIFVVSVEGYGGADFEIIFSDGMQGIAPGENKYFEILDSQRYPISQQNAKFFNFKHL